MRAGAAGGVGAAVRVGAHGSGGCGVETGVLTSVRFMGARGGTATGGAGGGLPGGDADARSVRERQQCRRTRQHARNP
ncbi:hypothetical protein GCM10010231_52680 [Streptomyces sindenensis]|nr:hypothetical protein GCM10010231_52680 [Streptomyces sindenensis]